ncbi:MAG: superoxide dismutase [Paraclostridium sp.]
MRIFKICIMSMLLTITTCTLGFASDEFKLMPLPYSYDALEPYIDKETMIIHHTKHHQAYVDNLNKIIANNPELSSKSLEDLLTNLDALPSNVKQGVINNAGGVYNHNFFWTIMGPNQSSNPTGDLSIAINKTFGNFDSFKSKFKDSAMSRFGSGWAWLVSDKNGNLSIISTANQDTPISIGLTPIIGIDVWEHAYYLKYKNKRSDYIDNWWNVLNWSQAAKNYTNR